MSLPEATDVARLVVGPLARRYPALRRAVNAVRGYRR
jgi:hypothetical protein